MTDRPSLPHPAKPAVAGNPVLFDADRYMAAGTFAGGAAITSADLDLLAECFSEFCASGATLTAVHDHEITPGLARALQRRPR